MNIATAASGAKNTEQAVAETIERLRGRLGASPSWVVAHYSVKHDLADVTRHLQRALGNVPIHAASSCQGAMTDEGLISEDGHSLALFGLSDPEGAYGTAYADLSSDPEQAAAGAAKAALKQAGREGELPTIAWITASPGCEERIIRGLEAYFGPNVPIAGGSAADDDVSGRWNLFTNAAAGQNGVLVSTLFCSRPVGFSFHSGYDPTSRSAKVTRCSGRNVHELNGRPAAEVYNEWIGGALSDLLDQPDASVLTKTTLHPLGRVAGSAGGVSYFQLSHPERITAGRGLSLFTEVAEGDEMLLMRGSTDSLVSRAGRVASSAIQNTGDHRTSIAGGLIVYCAGCMLTVSERMTDVVASLRSGLQQKPFLGPFTFGEQGCFLGGQNRHGNLMISALVFCS